MPLGVDKRLILLCVYIFHCIYVFVVLQFLCSVPFMAVFNPAMHTFYYGGEYEGGRQGSPCEHKLPVKGSGQRHTKVPRRGSLVHKPPLAHGWSWQGSAAVWTNTSRGEGGVAGGWSDRIRAERAANHTTSPTAGAQFFRYTEGPLSVPVKVGGCGAPEIQICKKILPILKEGLSLVVGLLI